MQDHVKILGVLHIISGALGLLIALIVAVFGLGMLGVAGVAAHEDPDAAIALSIIGVIGTVFVVLIGILSIPSLAAGFGLLNYRPWARVVTIILSALQLTNIPLGTALGIYGLWVLLNQQTQPLFAGPGVAAPQYPPTPPPQPPAPQ